MDKYFPNVVKNMDIKIQAKQTLRRTKSKRPTLRHIIIKLTKVKKKKILKAVIEK